MDSTDDRLVPSVNANEFGKQPGCAMEVLSTDPDAPHRSEPDSAAKDAVHRQFATEMGAAALAAGAGPDQIAQYLRALGERGRAQEFVAQQYAGRYALELLQNADDAAADLGRQGRVRFVLSEASLMVGDDGMGFGPEQVQALCTLGDSSKDRSKSIGYKGVGFKSVLEVTNTPQVYSADTSFGFDEARVRRELQLLLPTEDLEDLPIPAYAFPFELTLDDAGPDKAMISQLRGDGYTTIIRLPLKLATSREHANRILSDTIRPRLLLLTQGLEMLAVEGTDEPFMIEMLRESLGTCTRAVLESDAGALEEWLLYRRSYEIGPSDPRPTDPRWKRTTSFGTAVAVSLVDNAPRPAVDTPLHVYFPTDDDCGYPVILHADWALDPDRRHLARSADFEAYNHFVTRHLINYLAAEVVPDLLDRFPGSAGLAECLCPDERVVGAGAEIAKLCVTALDAVPFLPNGSGGQFSPTTAWLLPERADAAGFYRWTDYAKQTGSLRPDVEVNKRVSAFLTRRYRRRRNSIPFTKLRGPSPEDTSEYYQFLRNLLHLDFSYLERVKSMRSIPILSGGMGKPGEPIFTATSERSRTDLTDYFQFARGSETWELEVLHKLGVEEASWRNVMLHYLVPLLATPDLANDDRIKGLRALQSYLQSRDSTDERIRDAIGDVLLPARTSSGVSGYWTPAKELYFGNEWGESGSDIEATYGPFNKAEFLVVPDAWEPLGFDADFFRFIGVRDHPRLLREPRAVYWQRYSYEALLGGRATTARWASSDEVAREALCQMGHPASQWLQDNCAIDRFDQVTRAADLERSEAMLRQIVWHWEQYEGGLAARVSCGHGSHKGKRDRTIPSLLAFELKSLPWVPAIRDGVARLVSPADAWELKRGTPGILQSVITRLPDSLARIMPSSMATAIGLPSPGAASPSALVRLLESLGNCAESAPEQLLAELKSASEWVLDHLESALADQDLPTSPDVVLPAFFRGEIRFEIKPWATDDPILESAYSRALPVLWGADRFPRCCKAFGLPSLDEAPKEVLPIGEILERSLEAQGMIRGLSPLILAQLTKRHPGQRDSAAETLATCVARCWSRIELSVHAGSVTVSVPPVPAFPHRDQAGRWHLELAVPDGELVDWSELGKMIASALENPSQGKEYALWLLAGETIHPHVMKTEQLTNEDIAQAQFLLSDYYSRSSDVGDTWTAVGPDPDNAAQAGSEASQVHSMDPVMDGPGWAQPAVVEDGSQGRGTDASSPTVLTGDGDLASSQVSEGPFPSATARPSARDILLTPPVAAGGETDEAADALTRRRPSARAHYAFDGDDLPPVDHDRVTSIQPSTGPAREVAKPARDGHGTAVSDLDPDYLARRDFRGRRAEALVVESERRRLRDQGMSPEAVLWISERFPFAPYDLESLDEGGQKIYIEVKATQSADPSEPFPISSQELAAAREHGSQHWLYRVIRVDAPDPTIVRVRDPHAVLQRGEAAIDPTKYLMRIGLQGSRDALSDG